MDLCPEHRRLAHNVESVLAKLADLTQTHLRMFQEGDYVGSKRIDRELELTVGEKERDRCPAAASYRTQMPRNRIALRCARGRSYHLLAAPWQLFYFQWHLTKSQAIPG
jgi:hypothetical protein